MRAKIPFHVLNADPPRIFALAVTRMTMILGRKAERDAILRELRVPSVAPECKRIISLHGDQGVGTSTLSAWLRDTARTERIADAVVFLDTSLPACRNRSGIIELLDASVVYPGSDFDTRTSEVRSILSADGSSVADEGKQSSILSEALFVDWIQALYPQLESDASSQREVKVPKKVLLIIDRHADNQHLVDAWLLDHLLITAFIKKFADFHHYHSPYLKPDVFVRQFIDLRVVIAGKSPLDSEVSDKRWERWKSTILPVHLRGFDSAEVTEVLKDFAVSDPREINECIQSTGGHPVLVASWLQRRGSETSSVEESDVTHHDWQYFTSSLSPQEIRYLRIAASCEWVNGDVLKCFLESDAERSKAESFLRSHWSCVPCLHNGIPSYTLLGQARTRLRALPTPSAERSMDELDIIFRTYSNLDDVFSSLRPRQILMVRALAHAARFDADLLPGRLFPNADDDWEHLVTHHADLFDTHAATRSLKQSLRTRIRENNAYYAPSTCEEWSAIISSTWREQEARLAELIAERKRAQAADERRLGTVLEQLAETKDKRDKATDENRETTASMRGLQRTTPADVTNRDGFAAVISLIVFAVVSLPALFSESMIPVFGMTLDRQSALVRLLLVFSGVFFVLTLVFGGRSVYLRKQRAQQRRNIIRIKALQDQVSEQTHAVRELTETLNSQELNARRLRDEIASAHADITRLSTILGEPYIDDPIDG